MCYHTSSRGTANGLKANLPQSAIIELMQPCDDKDMAAYPVSKILSAKNINSDIPNIIKPLDIYQQKLF